MERKTNLSTSTCLARNRFFIFTICLLVLATFLFTMPLQAKGLADGTSRGKASTGKRTGNTPQDLRAEWPAQLVKSSTTIPAGENEPIAQGYGYGDRYASNIHGVGVEGAFCVAAFLRVHEVKGGVLKFVDAIGFQMETDPQAAILILDNEKKVIYKETATMSSGLNHLILQQPFTFTEDGDYYIGYLAHPKSNQPYILGYDHVLPQVIPDGNWMGAWMKDPNTGERLKLIDTQYHSLGTALVYAGIEGVSALDHVAFPIRLEALVNVLPSASAEFKLRFRNLGLQPIRNAVFNIQIGEDAQDHPTEVSVGIGETASVSFIRQMPSSGKGNVTVRLTKVNDKEHFYSSFSLGKPYKILSEGGAFPKKTVLMERFMSEKATVGLKLPYINEAAEALQASGLQLSIIEHHANDYFTDHLSLEPSALLMPYLYGDTYPFVPALLLDRLPIGEGQTCAMYPGLIPTEDLPGIIQDSLQYGEFTSVEQHIDDGKIAVKASGTITNDLTEDLYITAVVTESHLKAKNQKGAEGEYFHDNEARLFLSSAFGSKATISGNHFEVEFPSQPFSGNWDAKQLKIVLFATTDINQETKANFNKRMVLFSTHADWKGTTDGISEKTMQAIPLVTVQNGYLNIKGSAVDRISVYNISGMLVSESTDDRLLPGIYLVKTYSGDLSHTVKIVVK